MGVRCRVISNLRDADEVLPDWFREKYDQYIEFDRAFWVSRNEYKRYMTLSDFDADIQRVICETDCDPVYLLYITDDETYIPENVTLVYVLITKDEIRELVPDSALIVPTSSVERAM